MLSKLKKVKPDPILSIVTRFNADKNPKKINLSVGEFVSGAQVYKFKSVKKAEPIVVTNMNYRYLPIPGCPDFIENSRKFVFGKSNGHLGYQTVSGTGSLWLASQILELVGQTNVITSNVTWPNHNHIFNIVDTYEHSKNIDDLLTKIKNCKPTVFLFQSCCHNPTGIDYDNDVWNMIGFEIKRNNHTVILDNAYQGLSSGDPQVDNYSIKLFDQLGVPLIVCSSYAKNLGLYNQRLGSLFTNFKVENLDDHIKQRIRSSYSNPPSFGSSIFNKVMSEDYQEWQKECNELTQTLKKNRQSLHQKLTNHNIFWDQLVDGNGLFYMTPLSSEQIDKLRDEYSIYMLQNGRINIAGINDENIDYIVEKISVVQ